MVDVGSPRDTDIFGRPLEAPVVLPIRQGGIQSYLKLLGDTCLVIVSLLSIKGRRYLLRPRLLYKSTVVSTALLLVFL
jgi:hypothetical protein